MQLRQDPALERLRARVREFAAANSPGRRGHSGVRAPDPGEIPALREWTAALYEHGFLGVHWPVEHGGTADAHPLHEVVVLDELSRADAPLPVGAAPLAAAALIASGSTAQQAQLLPRIRSGEHIWCQLFSEPGAGSDLASLRTRAVPTGDSAVDGADDGADDGFVVDGQKVWTTNGQHADMGYLLARTDPDAPKHQGISAFALDMRLDGIDVRPLREMTGTSDFNEVFLDAVRVPADAVIGEVNAGWQVATASLMQERSAVGGVDLDDVMSRLISLAGDVRHDGRPALERDDVRQQLGRLATDVRVNEALNAHVQSRALHGTGDAADAPASKIFFSTVNLALAECGVALQGADGVRVEGDTRVRDDGWWQDAYLYARAYTIAGGANEVLRNLIAERALGMPKEPR